MRRLYCAGSGADRRYCIATSNTAASDFLRAEEARMPTEEDVRFFWNEHRLSERPSREVALEFGVSHQTVCNWRMKAKEQPYRVAVQEGLHEMIAKELVPGATVRAVSERLGVGPTAVQRVAKAIGFVPPKRSKRPSDDEIIRLSEGRTWRELTQACGVSLAALRNYVYAKPELAQAIRKRMKFVNSTAVAVGKIDPDVVREMHRLGVKPSGIADALGVEPTAVLRWFDKLGLARK